MRAASFTLIKSENITKKRERIFLCFQWKNHSFLLYNRENDNYYLQKQYYSTKKQKPTLKISADFCLFYDRRSECFLYSVGCGTVVP